LRGTNARSSKGSSLTLPVIILTLVTIQRLGELWLSNRNTRRLLARGAQEVGAGHYPLIVGVHILWLAALWWLAPGRPVDGFWLALFIVLQLARVWVIATLGKRWTTRIIILSDTPLVRRGPYRFVNHPNYVVVIGEIGALPLAFGLWSVALLLTLLNAAVLAIRIREENRALASLRA
jgi:methyltransferase